MGYVNCNICGCSSYKTILNVNRNSITRVIVKCNNCGLVYLNPQPKKEELKKYYPDNYYSFSQRSDNFIDSFVREYITQTENKGLRIYDRLKRLVLKELIINTYGLGLLGKQEVDVGKIRILDVGCGAGDFLLALDDNDYDKYGIDISDKAVEAGRAAGLNNIFCGDFEDATLPEGFFDNIRLWHVIEHTSNPLNMLEKANRLLKTDAMLIIGIPNIESVQFSIFKENWQGLDFPCHLYFFSFRTIEKLLKKAGFRIVSLKRRSIGIGNNLCGVIGESKLSRYLSFIITYVLQKLQMSDALEIYARKF